MANSDGSAALGNLGSGSEQSFLFDGTTVGFGGEVDNARNGPGRPSGNEPARGTGSRGGSGKSNAQRQAEYRARKRAERGGGSPGSGDSASDADIRPSERGQSRKRARGPSASTDTLLKSTKLLTDKLFDMLDCQDLQYRESELRDFESALKNWLSSVGLGGSDGGVEILPPWIPATITLFILGWGLSGERILEVKKRKALKGTAKATPPKNAPPKEAPPTAATTAVSPVYAWSGNDPFAPLA